MPEQILKSIEKKKIVAILRGLSFDDNMFAIDTLISSGITNIEVTLNTENALRIIDYGRKKYDRIAHIGAGTVKNAEDVKKVVEVGAQFIITPNLCEEAVKNANRYNTAIIPGVFSPTEIVKAYELGCKMVKIFPAASLGSQYIKHVKGPLNDIKMMAVGGITIENAKKYLDNGADAIGVGEALIPSRILKNKDFEGLKKYLHSFKRLFK